MFDDMKYYKLPLNPCGLNSVRIDDNTIYFHPSSRRWYAPKGITFIIKNDYAKRYRIEILKDGVVLKWLYLYINDFNEIKNPIEEIEEVKNNSNQIEKIYKFPDNFFGFTHLVQFKNHNIFLLHQRSFYCKFWYNDTDGGAEIKIVASKSGDSFSFNFLKGY